MEFQRDFKVQMNKNNKKKMFWTLTGERKQIIDTVALQKC